MQSKIRLSEEEQNKKRVQVADSVEVVEHVERLVRSAHVLRKVGGREQISRKVIRPWVARNTGGPNLLGWWAAMCKKNRVPDLRLSRACWRGARTTREGKELEGPCKKVQQQGRSPR